MAATRGGRRSTPTPKPKKPKHKKPKTPVDRRRLISAAASATAAGHRFLLRHDLHLLPSQTLTLHSLLSSLSVSLSQSLSPSHSWFHRLLSSSPSSDHRWPLFFRLSKPSFTLLLRLLSPQLSSLPFHPYAALASTLFRLAHSAPYETLALLFDLGHPSAACRAFFSVCKCIHDRLSHLFEFKSDVNRVVVGFGWISLPNCCGVLGFGRFPVKGRLLGESGSLLVQAVVDSEGRFLDVSAGWPSTMKPDKILHQSKLVLGIETSREYLNGDCYKLSDGNSVPQYLLGDSCFPLLPWLITPYLEPGGEMETEFNSVHRKGMDLVGTAFRRVREAWKIVSGEWREECVEYFPFVVVTCCLLHNYLIKCSEEFQFLEEDVEYVSDQKLPMFEGEEDGEGKRIRDALALHLNQIASTTITSHTLETKNDPISIANPVSCSM